MKICTACNQHQEVDRFSFRNKAKGIRHNQCKECYSAYRKAHYRANKKKIIRKNKKRTLEYRDRNRDFIFNYLLNHPCVDCGADNPIVLDFDHTNGDKDGNISEMVINGYALDTIKSEIDKCEVRCSNCHRLRHAKENDFWMWRKLK